MIDALDIHVKGIVQGVGFRPFVYRLAKKYLINGWVMNAADGVHIHAEGDSKLVDEFVLEISENAPAAAQVTEIEIKEVPIEPFDSFEIRFSDDDAVEETTFVSPDLATCADCEGELFDLANRRYRYPFINCTNCGPRFTIIDKLPYDRCNTSMCEFEMCDKCSHEYSDPADRRFHAQPDACFECGPHISWLEVGEGEGGIRWGNTREESDAIIEQAVQLLHNGGILAMKGLGGFHLVCDANNPEAVAKLRKRKHRFGKAFAVMVADVDAARQLCHVNDEEQAVLTSAARPIVLLRKLGICESETSSQNAETQGESQPTQDCKGSKEVAFELAPSVAEHQTSPESRSLKHDKNTPSFELAPGVADKLPELGVMLPYTPLQHLLLHDFAEVSMSPVPALVMTSGNLHDEPICIKDDEARERLSGIADAFLGNNREILTRFDDSVVRVIRAGSAGYAVQMIRRARGFAPAPISLPAPDREDEAGKVVFAAGPEQKNTFTFLRMDDSKPPTAEAFVSQHIGDMENADAFAAWLEAKTRFEQLFDLEATELACDLHPEYITTKWAHEQAALHSHRHHHQSIPLVQVQHHHAHIASVIAESGLAPDAAICGIAFDGTGYGADGNIWGGEVLLSNLGDYERFANFVYVPMPGGAAAVKKPLQMAYGVLWEFDLLEHPGAKQTLENLGETMSQNLDTMIEEGINTPVTSSVGRLFDAASAMLGICTDPTYEGEPAIMLEAAMYGAFDAQEASAKIANSDEVDVEAREVNKINQELSGSQDASAGSCDNASAPHDNPSACKIAVVKNTASEGSTAHDTSVVLLDAAPAFTSLLDDFAAGVPIPEISRRFHDAFVDAIVASAQLALALYDINTVALSGGVFMNRYIIEHAIDALEQAGFTVAINRELPPNDGCISFGQAVVSVFSLK